MRKSFAAASALLALVIMTGCRHRRAAVTLPPPPPPATRPATLPHAIRADLPPIPRPAPPEVVLGGAVERAPSRHESRRRHAPQPAGKAQNSGANASQSPAAGEEPPATTPIGQLSAAPNTQGLPGSTSIRNEIRSIQQQLNEIHHKLSPKQQRTAAQVRTFLAKAANALQAGDLDGAHTLTVKARVLLGEIR